MNISWNNLQRSVVSFFDLFLLQITKDTKDINLSKLLFNVQTSQFKFEPVSIVSVNHTITRNPKLNLIDIEFQVDSGKRIGDDETTSNYTKLLAKPGELDYPLRHTHQKWASNLYPGSSSSFVDRLSLGYKNARQKKISHVYY